MFRKHEFPLEKSFSRELVGFWENIFGPGSVDMSLKVMMGDEIHQNSNTLFIEQISDRIVGTCVLTIDKQENRIGGLGEVATDPEFRGSGIATKLCGLAVDHFCDTRGSALFLGTGNSNAARIYHRLGWSKLPGTQVMVRISDGESPEEFLDDYFKSDGMWTVRCGSVSDRLPLIPLLIIPHAWYVLDMNVGIFSSRYRVQRSCMGLYPRYEGVSSNHEGAWFSCVTGQGRIVGLSTAKLDLSGGCMVDGFTHNLWSESWEDLMAAAISWSDSQSVRPWTAVSLYDEEKRLFLQELGFRSKGRTVVLDSGNGRIKADRLEWTL